MILTICEVKADQYEECQKQYHIFTLKIITEQTFLEEKTPYMFSFVAKHSLSLFKLNRDQKGHLLHFSTISFPWRISKTSRKTANCSGVIRIKMWRVHFTFTFGPKFGESAYAERFYLEEKSLESYIVFLEKDTTTYISFV